MSIQRYRVDYSKKVVECCDIVASDGVVHPSDSDYVAYADHVAAMKRVKEALRECVERMENDGYHSDDVIESRALLAEDEHDGK
jgi:hypothetical protein